MSTPCRVCTLCLRVPIRFLPPFTRSPSLPFASPVSPLPPVPPFNHSCGARQRAVVIEQDKLFSQHGEFARIAKKLQRVKGGKDRQKQVLREELREAAHSAAKQQHFYPVGRPGEKWGPAERAVLRIEDALQAGPGSRPR